MFLARWLALTLEAGEGRRKQGNRLPAESALFEDETHLSATCITALWGKPAPPCYLSTDDRSGNPSALPASGRRQEPQIRRIASVVLLRGKKKAGELVSLRERETAIGCEYNFLS